MVHKVILISRKARLSRGDGVDTLSLLDDRRGLVDLFAEKVALDEVREPDLKLVAKELFGRYRKDLCNMC